MWCGLSSPSLAKPGSNIIINNQFSLKLKLLVFGTIKNTMLSNNYGICESSYSEMGLV